MCKPLILVSVAGLCLMFASPRALAQEAPGPTDKAAASQDLLRRCVAMEIENDGHKARMDAADKALISARVAAKDLGHEIDRKRSRLDRTDGDAVDAFNLLIDRHDALRDEVDVKVAAYNALIEEFNPAAERFNTTCAGVGHTWEVRYAEKQRQLKARGETPR